MVKIAEKSLDDMKKDYENLKSMLEYNEEEFRKASISEKTYKEVKEGYEKRMKELEQKISAGGKGEKKGFGKFFSGLKKGDKKKEDKKQEPNKEENDKEDEDVESENEEDNDEKEFDSGNSEKEDSDSEEPEKDEVKEQLQENKKKSEKKEEDKKENIKPASSTQETKKVKTTRNKDENVLSDDEMQSLMPAAAAGAPIEEVVPEPEGQEKKADVSIEMEKLKTLVDTVRESKKASDETMQTIFESVGEIRSMSFQLDANIREITTKFEKIEDEVSELKPQKIMKKFEEISKNFETHNLSLEKLTTKTDDMSAKLKKVEDNMKTIGNLENLSNINKDIQKRLQEINEVYKYIERISMKNEKVFIDLNKSMNDFIIYKSRQDNVEEVTKDLAKAIDGLGVKIEYSATKKELESFRGDVLVLQKQIKELGEALPIINTKLPESIESLNKKREDIQIFLNSLESSLKAGRIKATEYEQIKAKNTESLKDIDESLKTEWGAFMSRINEPEEEKDDNNKQIPKKEDIKPAVIAEPKKEEPSREKIKPVQPPAKTSIVPAQPPAATVKEESKKQKEEAKPSSEAKPETKPKEDLKIEPKKDEKKKIVKMKPKKEDDKKIKDD